MTRRIGARVTVSVMRRNRDVHALYNHLKDNPRSLLADLCDHFDWSDAKVRGLIRELMAADAAYLAGTEKVHRFSKRYRYSALPISDFAMSRHFPCTVEDRETRKLGTYSPPVAKRTVLSTTPTIVKAVRDPLVVLLMGEGRAPSLNFIDSLKGVPDVKSQTVCSPH